MTGINLLPKQLKEEKEKAQLNFKVGVVCFSLLLIFILGIIGLEAANQILALSLKASQTQMQFEEKEIAKLSSIEQKANQLNEILGLLDNLEKNQLLWTKILKEMASCTPSALQISSLTINTKTAPNFNIQGVAASRREIAKFKEKLEASSYFKNVSFVSSGQIQTDKGTAFNFNLTSDLENKR